MNYVRTALASLFIVALPLVLVTSNVRWAFNTTGIYELGFTRHGVAETTGLSDDQLSRAATQIREYFNSDEDELHVLVDFGSGPQELFNDTETRHMRDVKELVSNTYRVQEGAFLYLFLFISLGFLLRGSEFAGILRRLLTYGSTTTVVLVLAVGLVSLVAFGPLFTLFHEVSFANDFWQLDPRTSILVRMFPFDFWLETTIILAVASVVEAGAIVGLMTAVRWWQQWRRRIAQSRVPRYV